MANVFVKARAGMLQRDPITKKPLAESGEWKPGNLFWIRRIMQGDVIDATQEQMKAQSAPVSAPDDKPAAAASSGPSDPTPPAPASSKSK
jgi:hypothetical protein